MTAYAGDFPASHTAVCIPFDSFAASTGAPSAVTNFAAADVLIYKNGGTTQRTSASGITVTTSFDAQTGLQMIVIDTSDNTDAGFYAAGNEYQVAVADITIDSQTVRFWAGTFSIERAGGVLALLKATGSVKVDVVKWNSTTVATPATAGIPDVNTKNINNVAAATPGASGGLLISGSNTGTTTLGAMTVTGELTVSGGVAVTNSTVNGHGVIATGNGTGSGLRVVGGSGGIGLAALSSGSASAAKFAAQGTNAVGLEVTGIGSGSGFKIVAGSTGIGMEVQGGATSGDGIDVSVTSGIEIDANITGDITGTITTATNVTTVNGLAAGVITAASIATNAIDADALAADAVTEIQSGLATAAALTTAAGEVTAIKAKTDSLAFTVAGQVDANVQYVNDVLVTGTGAAGDEWGP